MVNLSPVTVLHGGSFLHASEKKTENRVIKNDENKKNNYRKLIIKRHKRYLYKNKWRKKVTDRG